MPLLDNDVDVRAVARDRADSRRFLKRASWGVFMLLAGMGLGLWLLPITRRSGHRTIAEVIELSVVAGFFVLIGLVLILRRRLALEVDRLSADQDLLLKQNRRLEEQSADLARQTATVEQQTIELRMQSAELQSRTNELEISSRRLGEAQRVARLGYWEVDPSTGARFWSDELYRIAGLEVGTVPPPTDKFLAAIHPDDRARVAEFASRAAQGLADFTDQYRITPPGGPTRVVQATGRVIVDDHGEKKVVGTVQDITERVLLERQLRRAQKMEALGQLAGGVAHDFNNMLTVIEGYTAMLLTDHGIDEEAKADVEEIRMAAGRAATLTRQLLAFSRQQVLQPRVLNINDAVGNMEKMLRRLIDAHIEFRTKLDANLDAVKADPTQIEQVLMNLVVNARDAMPQGGTLTIETSNVVLDAAFSQRATAHKPGRYVMLAVSDTGTGIPQGILDRIFEPFFTTKETGRGTGLGLATVQGIIEQSGGHVWVYSESGHGTTFKVYLPRSDELSPAVPAAKTKRAPLSGHETILLVEDDSSVRLVAASALRRAGHTVLQASNGVEAIKIAESEAATIDLVVSDMVMPGMGGRALAEEIERRWPEIPMLMMSGYTRDAIPGNADTQLNRSFLEKPFTPDQLIGKVRALLDRGQTPHTGSKGVD